MGNRAYIAGNLDGAFFFENGRATLVQGKSNTASGDIDNYMLSQIFASNPEITEVDYSSMDDLRAKIETEHEKQEVLGMALELMDTSLSENYRKEIAVLLSAELNEKPHLFIFIQNRFLATPLPDGFNSQAAREVAGEVSEIVAYLYNDLEQKSDIQ